MEIDLTGVEVKGFGVVPEGTYEANIVKMELKDAKDGQSKYFSVQFSIQDEGKYKGRKVFENFTLKPTGLWKLKTLLEAAGIDTSVKVDFQPSDLIGSGFSIAVKVGTNNKGDQVNSVQYVNALRETAKVGVEDFDF